MYDVMMLILYGAMFAAVILTFLRWGALDDAPEPVEAWRTRGVACGPPVEDVPPMADARATCDGEDRYAKAN
jgi:hypothetical protein